MLREPVVLGAGVIRRDTALADGRDLFYYDDPDTTLGAERGIDQRALDPRPATATMRQDILTGDWISIAAARQNRAFLPPAELDPLSPQTPTNPSEIPSRYDVAVFENRSPSFGPALSAAHGDAPEAPNPPRGLDDLDALGLGSV
ncbi:MAG TPA: galactose-1-phosphate uridylyltransferase, partial [Microbacterium sp.]|nr:galactose-1-phosphate uridylyltransferase [Microbacterium sp.]